MGKLLINTGMHRPTDRPAGRTNEWQLEGENQDWAWQDWQGLGE